MSRVVKQKKSGGNPESKNPFDYYRTPPSLAIACLSALYSKLPSNPMLLDPGAADGVWGQAARKIWPKAIIHGIELRPLLKPDGYDDWYNADFLTWKSETYYDAIIGNPPYSISNGVRDKELAEKFIHHSFELVDLRGYVVQLLKFPFLCGAGRRETLYSVNPPTMVFSIGRVPFNQEEHGNNTNMEDYGFYIFQKGVKKRTEIYWMGKWKDGVLRLT